MTGAELKAIRRRLSQAVGDPLSHLDMAKLIGLSDPGGNGADTYRKWEIGAGPSGPAAALLMMIDYGLSHDRDPKTYALFLAYVRDRVGIIPT